MSKTIFTTTLTNHASRDPFSELQMSNLSLMESIHKKQTLDKVKAEFQAEQIQTGNAYITYDRLFKLLKDVENV